MDSLKTSIGKDSFLAKTWKRCRSLPRSRSSRRGVRGLSKSKSWNGEKTKKTTSEAGFFPVYVGPDKQKFSMRTKYVNHPLFSMLLEEAETEYGYNCNGPILLPCDVGLFCNVLAEMQAKDVKPLAWTSFVYGSCGPFNPGRRLGIHGADRMGKGYGCFEALPSSSFITMN